MNNSNIRDEVNKRKDAIAEAQEEYDRFILDLARKIKPELLIHKQTLEIIVEAYDNRKGNSLSELDSEIIAYRILYNFCKKFEASQRIGEQVAKETTKVEEPVEVPVIEIYDLSYQSVREAALELKQTREWVEAIHVYKQLLKKGKIKEDKEQRRSIGIKIGRYLTKINEKEEIFESVAGKRPQKYHFKKEITEPIQEDQPVVREIRQDLSSLTDDEIYIRIKQGIKDNIFTEDQVRNIVGDKISYNRLNKILVEQQGYTVQRTNNGGPVVFSLRDRKVNSSRFRENDVFIIGLNRAKKEKFGKTLRDYGVDHFTYLSYEDVEGKSPNVIPDSIANAKYIIVFPSIGSHKISEAIESKIDKEITKFLTIDNIFHFEEFLSKNRDYFTLET